MDGFSFWKGDSFSLLEYLSLLSTSYNTSFSKFPVYYDEFDHPDTPFWHMVDEIPRINKQPASELLDDYLARFVSPGAAPITDVRILADIFRYAHLYSNGGAWLDLDTLQVRDLVGLMEEREFTAGWEAPVDVNIAVLSFPPGHPVLEALLSSLDAILQRDHRPFNAVGPPLMTRILTEQNRLDQVMDIPYFYPIDYHENERVLFGRYPLPLETHSIHVWALLNRKYFENKEMEDFNDVDSTFFDQVRALMEKVPRAAVVS